VQFVPQFQQCAPYSFQGGWFMLKTAKMNERSLSILCIDDDEQVRDFLNACFKRFNHRVMLASSGKHGLELFRTATLKKEPYEVVITDMGMPEMDGQQVARTIKGESPNTPVILMTGMGTIASDDNGTPLEVDAVISKPPCLRELNDLLLRIVAPALGGKSEMVA
jgi:CheY-like chemotaxis protein